MQLPSHALELLPCAVKVAKLDAQLASLTYDTVLALGPVTIGADATQFDELETHFAMYVPGKYLPLLIACRMTPKEALITINTEAVTQNEQDTLAPLIDWLRVAVPRSAVDPNAHSAVAHSALPFMPLMEPAFAERQTLIGTGYLPGWTESHERETGGGTPGGRTARTATTVIGGLGGGTTNSQYHPSVPPAAHPAVQATRKSHAHAPHQEAQRTLGRNHRPPTSLGRR
jgi:hypothetical protein